MTKRNVKIKDRKDLTIKFDKATTIDTYVFEKEKEYKITLENKEGEVDGLEHDKDLPKDTFKGKIKAPKKTDSDTDTEKDVELVGKFHKGYFWDSIKISEVKDANGSHKLEKELEVSSGGDMWGLNYYAWGGIAIALIAIIVGGYYWWTNYNKEEEEENI